MKDFGEQAYFLQFPEQVHQRGWPNPWLCYSANFSPGWNGVKLDVNPPGGRYGLCLHELKLQSPEDQPPKEKSPMKAAVR